MSTEQVFRSPGFFEREIDLSERKDEITGVPAGIVGTSTTGPAFVPVTVGSYQDFVSRFGDANPDADQFGPYAVREFLENRTALTFIRVLGAGANESTSDFENTLRYGTVKNAGFTVAGDNNRNGDVKFIVAKHFVSAAQEGVGYPVFSDNSSYPDLGTSNTVNLVRGMILFATGTRALVLNHDENWSHQYGDNKRFDLGRHETCTISGKVGGEMLNRFKLVISSSAGSSYSNEDAPGLKVFTASLDPSDSAYIGKILNTDPESFQKEQYLLYGDFAVENEIASVDLSANSVGIASGSHRTSGISGVKFNDLYGRFDTRYAPAKTTMFVSQKYGQIEYNLFSFETIADGDSSERYKISIANVQRSTDPNNRFGTFDVQVRDFFDSDTDSKILETYGGCTLNPSDENYIARKVGDFKSYFNFDAERETERRVVVTGKYPNKSSRVRVIMSADVEDRKIPQDAVPFGFMGLPVPKTNHSLVQKLNQPEASTLRLTLSGAADTETYGKKYSSVLSSSLAPPVPMTFKCTRGNLLAESSYTSGYPGLTEQADSRYYWGIKTTRVPETGSISKAVFNANASSTPNPLVTSYSKMLGIPKLDALTTGSAASEFSNNGFTLARVALQNRLHSRTLVRAIESEITGSPDQHMREAAYLRNARVDSFDGTVGDGNLADKTGRLTLQSLMNITSSVYFNKFSSYAKFTNIMYGGFDGVNILDKDMARLNDRSAADEIGGKGKSGLDIGLNAYTSDSTVRAYDPGTGKYNNIVASYRAAIRIMTDPMVTRVNILAVPGQRAAELTDYALERVKEYTRAIYLMDFPSYNSDLERMYDGDGKRPDVTQTRQNLAGRGIDNNYAAVYFPDCTLTDRDTGRSVKVPASLAALAALGFNDRVAYPWFAPAGFNRGALANFTNVAAGLSKGDRDDLYDDKINPIATFPNANGNKPTYVIFGQKTLQQAKSAIDRVNVRRMLLEVKRLVEDVASRIVFEQNTPGTRARFISQVTPLLSTIQSQQGIDEFRVVMDDTNNSVTDVESNRLNGRIVVVPTRAVEYIAIDFIITNSGVSFD